MPRRTEADLCAAFVAALEPGWVVYPETAGWDMLLVRTEEAERGVLGFGVSARPDPHPPIEVGTQVGIEAKLRASFTVLAQATGWSPWRDTIETRGPDYRAVLVPKYSGDFSTVCSALNLLALSEKADHRGVAHHDARRLETMLRHRSRWCHAERHRLPEVVPDVPAGVPSPSTVSQWKIDAIKLCMLLRERGWLTRQDFREHRIDPGRWYHNWLVPDGKVGRIQRWILAPGWKPWDDVHPGVAAQLREKDAGCVDSSK